MRVEIEKVFDKLYKIYGDDENILQYKNDLIYVYENEESWRSAEILKYIKPKHWIIDETGKIQRVM